MDWKSDKKIRNLFLAGILFVVIVSLGMFLFAKQEWKNRNTQLTELVVMHPELKSELMENFSFYERQTLQEIGCLCLTVWILTGFFFISVYKIWKNEWRKDRSRSCEAVEKICQQLEAFRRGEFELLPALSEIEEVGEWSRILELLRELGYYFAGLKERLAQEENSTKTLITDISHQLKTPLASLQMSHDLSKSKNLTEAEREEFIQKEEQEILKLTSLLEELVKLSRLEHNMIQIKPETNSIKKTVTEAVNQVFLKAHRKQIEIWVDMAEDVEFAHDAKWTAEAFVNIIDNAVKYSKPNTTITIRVNHLPGSLLIEVEDEGQGVSEEELHKIFQRFYRGKEASKSVKEGAGVGLYLARSIIEQQGGTIVAKRKIRNGMIFKILFPL